MSDLRTRPFNDIDNYFHTNSSILSLVLLMSLGFVLDFVE